MCQFIVLDVLIVIAGHVGTITCLKMAHCSLVLWSSSADGTVRKWDVSSGRPGISLRQYSCL